MIRIMDATSQYPNGYVRIYNSYGQPVDCNLQPGTRADTHIPEDEDGPFPEFPLAPYPPCAPRSSGQLEPASRQSAGYQVLYRLLGCKSAVVKWRFGIYRR